MHLHLKHSEFRNPKDDTTGHGFSFLEKRKLANNEGINNRQSALIQKKSSFNIHKEKKKYS